jgi:hypothetical protein
MENIVRTYLTIRKKFPKITINYKIIKFLNINQAKKVNLYTQTN